MVLTPTEAIMIAAEEASKELLFILKALGSRSCTVTNAEGIPEITGAGTYTLWLRFNSGGEMVPTYVGCTTRSIGQRLNEHVSFKSGKIRELLSGVTLEHGLPGRAKSLDGVHVEYIETDRLAAAMVEAILLDAFDFAQNTAGNGPSRAIKADPGIGTKPEVTIERLKDTGLIKSFIQQFETTRSVIGDFCISLDGAVGRH
ncbi:hypothetical protein WL71_16240 [Burkholderia ubonensis]|uniref:GIY-YIG domain-containing protein n=2 Tax=Burkholderia ubonensis TaxID=101571 RepID=A0A119MP98_9BURK|nr:hypothetical protein WL70_18135 [Burkholderia ubonensis]KWD83855.1 hypothetical protein WL71_16240 [Burkholderia ubonensis]KWE04725.1 hypothetical protein WL72_01500 [Burkholderia ubonensis]KWE11102.1 hypothetical protein WL73_33750 [Burkholderia ubonensis]